MNRCLGLVVVGDYQLPKLVQEWNNKRWSKVRVEQDVGGRGRRPKKSKLTKDTETKGNKIAVRNRELLSRCGVELGRTVLRVIVP